MTRVIHDTNYIKKKYDLITADMLFNIIMNLKDNNLSFGDLAEYLCITQEELFDYITKQEKDFYVCLEAILYLEEKNIFKNYSRLKEQKHIK